MQLMIDKNCLPLTHSLRNPNSTNVKSKEFIVNTGPAVVVHERVVYHGPDPRTHAAKHVDIG